MNEYFVREIIEKIRNAELIDANTSTYTGLVEVDVVEKIIEETESKYLNIQMGLRDGY